MKVAAMIFLVLLFVFFAGFSIHLFRQLLDAERRWLKASAEFDHAWAEWVRNRAERNPSEGQMFHGAWRREAAMRRPPGCPCRHRSRSRYY